MGGRGGGWGGSLKDGELNSLCLISLGLMFMNTLSDDLASSNEDKKLKVAEARAI